MLRNEKKKARCSCGDKHEQDHIACCSPWLGLDEPEPDTGTEDTAAAGGFLDERPFFLDSDALDESTWFLGAADFFLAGAVA